MFNKLIRDHVSGSMEGRAAVTPPPPGLPKGTPTSSDSKGKQPAIMTPRASSKCAKLSFMGASPISSTRQAATLSLSPFLPHRDSGNTPFKLYRFSYESLYIR
ncbi:UNVERIFIED_CONTAM: hypothetical protein Sradi_4444000 [Sesamum radiatum]|uniref:Uncharacterized protein n=1 Tax=Sesamum radiatum TaxID=300843 RepID=A0AAW2NQG3_SESRA